MPRTKWPRKLPAKGSPARAKAIGLRHGFRSGLEETLAAQIKEAGQPVHFETFKLPYLVPEKRHLYTPDFKLPNGIIIEGKGIFDATDRAKHLFVKAQYPDLDIRFVFSNANAKIGPGAKQKLWEWAEKYGYRWGHKTIPPEWFTEEGPLLDPMTVISEGPYGYLKRAGGDTPPR